MEPARTGGLRFPGPAAGDRLSEFRDPARLLASLGIEAPSQIHIEAIAQACGATIVYQPLEGSEARLIGYRDRAIITVNQSAPRSRQRFSAAHELGHWMWDRGKMAFTCRESQLDGDWENDLVEKRANRYAADLLLPPALFRERAAGLGVSFATVSTLAGEFSTSFTATAIRLVELATVPCALTGEAGENGTLRSWLVASPALSPAAERRTLPARTGAAALAALRPGGRREVRRLSAHRTLCLQTWPE